MVTLDIVVRALAFSSDSKNREDIKDENSLISTLSLSEIDSFIKKGIISGGMLPKVKACKKAVAEGVNKTHIIDGRIPHSILLEVFTDEGVGTEITK